jgi:hypothetical protein
VVRVAAALPKPDPPTSHTFPVLVSEELLRIPHRVYHDLSLIDLASLNAVRTEILDCLLTRHHNGYVREEHLKKILDKNHPWIPPFVIQLVGEYVIEVLYAIRDALRDLDHELYRAFLISNPAFFRLTKQRLVSYRACYYSGVEKSKYVGFEIVNFFDNLARVDSR